MTTFYDLLDRLKEELLGFGSVNTVTKGNLSEVDLQKTTIYPLTHLNVSDVVINTKTVTFNLNILAMDIVDQTNRKGDYDVFYGQDNTDDILNTQLAVINYIHTSLSRGNLHIDGYQTSENLSAEPFTERFENILAGWEGRVQVVMRNDISIC